MREIKEIFCSCQYNQNPNFSLIKSTVTSVDCTNEENAVLGCGSSDCCSGSFECSVCGTRFSFALEAAEWED